MKKLSTFFIAILMLISIGKAQTTIFADDFEAYNVGDYVSTGDGWQTWSGATGTAEDAIVSDEYNHTTAGTKCMKVVANNDMVHLFGDLSSGNYQINFLYFMPTGQGGYFNVEHAFGSTWAFSVNFYNNGTGDLNYNNGAVQTFAYTQNTWIPITIDVDLDNDLASLTIETVVVDTWQFSTEESGTTTLNILDCINFYGYTTTGLNPPYYMDDFEVIQLEAGQLPQEISVNTTTLTTTGESHTITITNEGEDALTFEAYAYYPNPVAMVNPSNNGTVTNKTVVLKSPENKKFDKAIPYEPNSKDETLTYVNGDITQGLGWNSETTAHAVALFPHNMIQDFIGMEVSNVIIFTQDLPINTSAIEVWEGYDINYGGPVDLVGSQDFTPIENGQASVNLTEPVFVNGKDLWVGWTFTDPGAGFYCIAMDAGPPTAGVNYTKTGIAWGVVDNAAYGNFGIVATLTGTAINTWLDLDVSQGTITGGSSQDISVSFDLTDLAHGTYESTLVIDNNDADESWYEIPVTLTVGVGVNEMNDGIMTFPNPVSNMFSIVSDSKIQSISITDLTGKMIRKMTPLTSNYTFDMSSLSKGVYMIMIETETQSITRKVVVK